MTLEDLQRAVRARPFIPFHLRLTNGESLEVHHPEMCMPGARSTVTGMPSQTKPLPVIDSYSIVDLLHIVRLEPIQQVVPSNGSV